MTLSLELKIVKTGSYFFEEPLLDFFQNSNCQIEFTSDRIIYHYDTPSPSIEELFIVSEDSDPIQGKIYCVSTKFNYNIHISVSSHVPLCKISSHRKDGFSLEFKNLSSTRARMPIFENYEIENEMTFEFCAGTAKYFFAVKSIIRLINDINSILETEKFEISRRLYQTTKAFGQVEDTGTINSNLSKVLAIYGNGEGDLQAIDYLETCLKKNTEPIYYYNIGRLHFIGKRYFAACRSITSAIPLYPNLAGAYYLLAKSIYEIYKGTSSDFESEDESVINLFVQKHLLKAKSLGSSEATAMLKDIFKM